MRRRKQRKVYRNIDDSLDVERHDLKAYEVSIELVDAARNRTSAEKDSFIVKNFYSNASSMISNCSQYHYQIEDVLWEKMAEIGLDRDRLEEMDALDALLKGYKTPILIPVLLMMGEM